ncbi:hypothetical protein LC605_25420 [Nostoc sp. CHAB 5836]|nr:hypothetical protein [Nostoc sp. CHAB 5836]
MLKTSQSTPSWRIAARSVPSLKSRLPQSGNAVTCCVLGLNHFDPYDFEVVRQRLSKKKPKITNNINTCRWGLGTGDQESIFPMTNDK